MEPHPQPQPEPQPLALLVDRYQPANETETADVRRVRALEEAGYIQGYRGLLDPRRLGFDVTVFASVHLASQADADLRAFEDFVRAEPLVRECWMLSGEVDFILKCVAADMATFQDFVTHLTAAPHVRNVRTSLVLHNSKYEAAVPLEVKVPG